MALKISIPNSNVGVPFAEAYARVTNVYGNKNTCQYQVGVSANKDARENNAQDVAQHAFYAPMPQDMPLLMALYAHLKTQPGFESAEDC